MKKYLIWIIFAMSLLIRLSALFQPTDFWHDDAFTYLYSKEPVSFIIDSNDVHPPLYYLVMKVFLFVSEQELFIRATSILFWVAFFWASYHFLKKHYSEQIALIVLTLMSVSSTMIYYSIEPRNYMMGMFFVVMQLIYFKKLEKEKLSLGYITFSLLMLYTHYYTGLLLIVELIMIIPEKKLRMAYFKNVVLIAFFSLPLLHYLFRSITKIQSFWFKEVGFSSFLSSLSYQFILPESMNEFYIMALFFIFVIIGLSFTVKNKRRVIAYALFFIPLLIVFFISQFSPMYHHRFFLFFSIGIYLIIAEALVNVGESKFKIFAYITFILLFVGMSIAFTMYKEPTDLRQASEFLKTQKNLPIVHVSTFSQSPFKYYFRDYDTPQLLMTKLDKKERFTAGGSVIKSNELITSLPDWIFGTDGGYYLLTDSGHLFNGSEMIYNSGGVVIYAR